MLYNLNLPCLTKLVFIEQFSTIVSALYESNLMRFPSIK